MFNDDIVEPGSGFPTHPHEEMEIITIVLKGEMTHKDSMDNKTLIKSGDVQRLSAGTGLTHSEFNLAKTPVHFYQIWIFPDKKGLSPSYDQKSFSISDWKNRLFPVASGQGKPGTVTIHTDATIYRCDLDKGMELSFGVSAGRRIFMYMTGGFLYANGQTLYKNEQGRIDIEESLVLKAEEPSEFIKIDVPSCKGWDYNAETLSGKKSKYRQISRMLT